MSTLKSEIKSSQLDSTNICSNFHETIGEPLRQLKIYGLKFIYCWWNVLEMDRMQPYENAYTQLTEYGQDNREKERVRVIEDTCRTRSEYEVLEFDCVFSSCHVSYPILMKVCRWLLLHEINYSEKWNCFLLWNL